MQRLALLVMLLASRGDAYRDSRPGPVQGRRLSRARQLGGGVDGRRSRGGLRRSTTRRGSSSPGGGDGEKEEAPASFGARLAAFFRPPTDFELSPAAAAVVEQARRRVLFFVDPHLPHLSNETRHDPGGSRMPFFCHACLAGHVTMQGRSRYKKCATAGRGRRRAVSSAGATAGSSRSSSARRPRAPRAAPARSRAARARPSRCRAAWRSSATSASTRRRCRWLRSFRRRRLSSVVCRLSRGLETSSASQKEDRACACVGDAHDPLSA